MYQIRTHAAFTLVAASRILFIALPLWAVARLAV